MNARQICDRMHDKLRGDEDNLVADWDCLVCMDTASGTGGVNDNGPNGLDGALATDTPSAEASYWIADLSFDAPNYPYITTQASYQQVGDPSQPAPNDETIYALTFTVLQGNGAPLANQALFIWFVQHTENGLSTQPATIQIGPPGSIDPATIQGITPQQAGTLENFTNVDPTYTYPAPVTDSSGQVTLWVTTADLQNGPSLDVYTSFMPSNERYHVNALVNNQTLVPPTPPSLIAQSKLLQDYYWSSGGVINSSRGRPTYRVTLTCLNADNSARSNEQLELYAADFLTIEVQGTSYALNTQNYQSFYTDQEGELTLIADATDLQTANLSVWAGFMNPNARFTIDPAEDARASMSDPNGPMTQAPLQNPNLMTVYIPTTENPAGSTYGPALMPAAAFNSTQATSIGSAVQNVTSAGQEPLSSTNTDASHRGKGWSKGAAKTRFAAAAATGTLPYMTQPVLLPRNDVITSVHTMKHIGRLRPVTPESIYDSIQQSTGGAGMNGFVFIKGQANPITYVTETNAAAALQGAQGFVPRPAVTRAMPPSPDEAFDFFGSLWADIETVADNIWNDVEQFAITITNAINVAISVAGQIVSAIVHSVEEAIDAIANFFVQLALDIVDVIRFLELLFDFDKIIAAQGILDKMFSSFGPYFQSTASSLGASVTASLTNALTSSFQSSDFSGPTAANPATIQSSSASSPNPSVSGSNSVGSRSMYTKMKDNQGGITGTTPTGGDTAAENALASFQQFINDVMGVVSDLATLNSSDIGTQMQKVVSDLDSIIADIPALFGGVLSSIQAPPVEAAEWTALNALAAMAMPSLLQAISITLSQSAMSQSFFCSSPAPPGESMMFVSSELQTAPAVLFLAPVEGGLDSRGGNLGGPGGQYTPILQSAPCLVTIGEAQFIYVLDQLDLLTMEGYLLPALTTTPPSNAWPMLNAQFAGVGPAVRGMLAGQLAGTTAEIAVPFDVTGSLVAYALVCEAFSYPLLPLLGELANVALSAPNLASVLAVAASGFAASPNGGFTVPAVAAALIALCLPVETIMATALAAALGPDVETILEVLAAAYPALNGRSAALAITKLPVALGSGTQPAGSYSANQIAVAANALGCTAADVIAGLSAFVPTGGQTYWWTNSGASGPPYPLSGDAQSIGVALQTAGYDSIQVAGLTPYVTADTPAAMLSCYQTNGAQTYSGSQVLQMRVNAEWPDAQQGETAVYGN